MAEVWQDSLPFTGDSDGREALCAEQPEARSANPFEPIGPARTLLDITLGEAIHDVLKHLDGRKYRTSNLHPNATTGLFSGTEPLTNRELLRVLHPNQTSATGAIDKRWAKHWRSPGVTRSQKLHTLRSHSLDLLRSRRVDNAEIVRGWAFALIHAAVLDVVHEAAPELLDDVRARNSASSAAVEALASQAHPKLRAMVIEQFSEAQARLLGGRNDAKVDVFLHFSAYGLLMTMNRESHPFATIKFLLDVVYPELDRYGDPRL